MSGPGLQGRHFSCVISVLMNSFMSPAGLLGQNCEDFHGDSHEKAQLPQCLPLSSTSNTLKEAMEYSKCDSSLPSGN